MTSGTDSQMPLALRRAAKTETRSQFAALCYRITNDAPEILLVSSLNAKRWILPKGWPEHGLTPAQCAAREAWEEAGASGEVHGQSVGLYSYVKVTGKGRVPCIVLVYPMQVHALASDFPEARRRRRRWFTREKAAGRVREPELAHLLRNFDPTLLRR